MLKNFNHDKMLFQLQTCESDIKLKMKTTKSE